MARDRMIEALAGEPVETLPPNLRRYFERMCEAHERMETPREPIRADPAWEDFHGHDRADERRWLEAEEGKFDDDPYEWINENTGSST